MEQLEPTPAQLRFVRAVEVLALGTASLQERLSAAWLELMPLRQQNLPAPLDASFGVIAAEMLAAPDEPELLSEEAAAAAAERILGLMVAIVARPSAER